MPEKRKKRSGKIPKQSPQGRKKRGTQQTSRERVSSTSSDDTIDLASRSVSRSMSEPASGPTQGPAATTAPPPVEQRKSLGREDKAKKPATKRNTILWQYFTLEEGCTEVWPKAICNACKVAISRSCGSPSGMTLHLKNHHPSLAKEYLEKKNAANLTKVSISLKAILFLCVIFLFKSL